MAVPDDKQGGPARLKPGRHELSRDEVDDIQRARIISAMIEVAAEHGYLGAAVAPVVARAGVSRRTFYELFEGREDCFIAAFDWAVEQAREVMTQAQAAQRSWREQVRHAVAGLLVFLDSEPELARVLIVEGLAAGQLVLVRRAQVMAEAERALQASAPKQRSSEPLLLTAEGIVGGAFSVLHGRMLERQMAEGAARRPRARARDNGTGRAPGPFLELHGQLMALIALPYLGPRAAGEEITRTPPDVDVPEITRAGAGEGGRLLDRLDMRLTYRTVRCLLFIGENPGASNREIAAGAEVPDEGQTSKLLRRLSKLELISNSRPLGPGYPNRWTLTPQGEQVLSAVRGS
jgi:AcrR family transcriptional regulator/DNA-binding MarR family transcriptional regulator